jgi:autotransporter-associated beta strand protein
MQGSKKYAVMISAAVSASLTGRVPASSFLSANDLVVVQTNGDGAGGGNSVTLLDMAVNKSAVANSSGTTISLNLSANSTISLPTDTLSYTNPTTDTSSSTLGLVLPDTANSIDGSSHGGQITLSQDGHSLEMGTYLAPVGPVDFYGTEISPNGVTPDYAPRIITEIGPTGAVSVAANLSSASDYSAVDIRQVTSLNGTQFWSSGNGAKPYGDGTPDIGGIRFSTAGATSTTSLNVGGGIDSRTTTIYQGQLYNDSGSNNTPPGEHTLSQLGTGLQAITPPTWTPLNSSGAGYANGTIFGNQSPSFVTFNNGVSTVYQSDSTNGNIEKWTLVNGLWNYEGEIVFGKDQIENLVARVNADGSVSIFSDNNAGTNSVGQVFGFVDTGGAGQLTVSGLTYTSDSKGNHVYSNAVPLMTGTSPAGSATTGVQQFWGLSFAPSASAAVANQIWGNLDGVTGASGGSWSNTADWSAGAIPNASGSTATFGPALSATGTITLDGTKTVGHVVFNDSAANYTLAPGTGGSLAIDNTDPNASQVPSIYNSNGSQTIGVMVALANGVAIADHYQASMTFTAPITGTGEVDIYGPGSLTLAAASTYSGATNVHSGSVVVTAAGSLPTTTALAVGDTTDTAAVGLAASVVFNASTGATVRTITLGSLGIVSNGLVTVAAPATVAGRSVLVANTLSFTGTTGSWTGRLDLTGNDMVVTSGSVANITSQIAQGYNLAGGANWQGSGGITSSLAAANTAHLTGLGVIQNNQDGAAVYTAAKPFDTVNPAAAAVLVKYTYFGDANLDGKVDGSDYSLIDAGFASKGKLTGWYNGDFNYDGTIDGSDYALIDNAFNNQGTPLSSTALVAEATAQVGGPTAVPEPTAIAAAVLAGASLAIRRRRRA